jgi:uncharacterized protein involved in exopolysaccharide biosynthesis
MFRQTGQLMIRRGSVDAVRSAPIMRQSEEVGSEVDILKSLAVIDETVDQMLAQTRAGTFEDGSNLIFGVFDAGRPLIELAPGDYPTLDPSQLYKILKDNVRAQKFGESNVIEISLDSPNPRFAAAAVNTLIDVYEKYHLSIDQAPGQVAFFDREIDDVDTQINLLQQDQAKLMRERGIVDLGKQTELLTLRRHALQMQLDAVQIEKVAFLQDLSKIEAKGNLLETSFARSDPSVHSLQQRLFTAESQLALLKSQYQIDTPIVIAKIDEVRELRSLVLSETATVAEQQRHLLRQLLDKERELLAKIKTIENQMVEYPGLQAEFDRLDRDIKQRVLNRVDLVEQMFRATTLERSDQSMNKVRILGFAPVPAFPREARKAFKLAVALVLSLVASVVAALFVEGLDHTVSRREEVEERLRVPYLASIGIHQE